MWWEDAVVYQIYPRSFQDSDGDGIGDLRGIAQRLDHLVWLGVDALWLSPIYPSPLADFGYDVSDYADVDPVFGTMADFDALVARGARARAEAADGPGPLPHVDRAPVVPRASGLVHLVARDGPPNNWQAAFGGAAWSRDERSGRWYLHSFYPEQPDLDWRNPEVVAAMQDVVRFWLERGVDGFRVDAIDRLMKDPELRDDPPAPRRFAAPARRESRRSTTSTPANAPDIGTALAALREAAGDALLVGEVYLPTASCAATSSTSTSCSRSSCCIAPWDAAALRAAIEPAAAARDASPGCCRTTTSAGCATRVGRAERPRRRGAAADAAGSRVHLPGRRDRAGRTGPGRSRRTTAPGATGSAIRCSGTRRPPGGFTTGEPWLPTIDPAARNVEAQRADPGSLLNHYRRLIAARRELGSAFRILDSPPGTLSYERDGHVVTIEAD